TGSSSSSPDSPQDCQSAQISATAPGSSGAGSSGAGSSSATRAGSVRYSTVSRSPEECQGGSGSSDDRPVAVLGEKKPARSLIGTRRSFVSARSGRQDAGNHPRQARTEGTPRRRAPLEDTVTDPTDTDVVAVAERLAGQGIDVVRVSYPDMIGVDRGRD